MITARPQKDLKAARSYFRQHLARGDYYSEQRRISGEWFGQGAARLGLDLKSPVTEQAFVRLCENRHPFDNTRLTVRQRQKDRRVFYDFTCSAPKSVSILALTVGDARIVRAHDEACRVALQQLETAAAARIRIGGQRADRTTGEIVAAMFRHEESRALDPQLHTHLVVFNATWDSTEKRWKALETSAMFAQIKLYTEVYRSELALRLQALGHSLRHTDHGFEIAGVATDIIERYSKRRHAILEEEARLTAKLGRPLSNDARAAVAHATRERKRTDLTPEAILDHQRSQLKPAELAALRGLVQRPPSLTYLTGQVSPAAALRETPAQGARPEADHLEAATGIAPAAGPIHPGPRAPVDPNAARAAIDYARDHLFERSSAVAAHALLREALQFGRGQVDLPALTAELQRRTEFIAVDGILTTKETLRQEQRLVALVNQGIGGCRPLAPGFRGDSNLKGEQRQALEFVLRSPDEVIGLRGRAGAGKTQLLQALVGALEQRYATTVLAPTAAAVEVLRSKGLRHAAAVQRFLADPDFQQSAAGRAIVVDEAGFLSVRDLLSLVEATRRLRARLILSGDARQHSGVEAGDALRLLETQSALRSVELKNIQRQIDGEYRAAIGELAEGKGQAAFGRLERLGAVEQLDDDTRYRTLAAQYVASVKAGKSALAVSPTWREIEEVTGEVRAQLRNAGLLGTTTSTVTAHEDLKWTRAQKRDLRNYKAGMILTFHKPTADFRRGEWGKVTTVLSNFPHLNADR